MNNRKIAPPMAGLSALLVIFAVLCLTVFAVLSLSTVRADRRLQEQSVSAVEGWYAADTAAETILARLRAGETVSHVEQDGTVYRYACKISETQALAVEVRVDGTDYEILRWQAMSTTDWQADTSLPVWTGE